MCPDADDVKQVGKAPNIYLWRCYLGLNYTVRVNHHVLNDQNEHGFSFFNAEFYFHFTKNKHLAQ